MSSFRQFLGENKIWWILPIVLVLGAVGYVYFSGAGEGTAGEDSPFEYDLF